VPGYHHGNLREAILDAATETIARDGIAALSLRAVATTLGVSHTAFRRHFGGREGVLNALAVRGYRQLAQALAGPVDFIDLGVAYVRFAVDHPGLFTVMFRTDLLDQSDPELIAARADSFAPLAAGVAGRQPADPEAGRVAGWGIVHGIATLALTGNLSAGDDLTDLTRRALALTYPTATKG
jgi:AcrR family transcriptional regulator